jgi:parvulin-like peptidyl-prolyl isomerase
MGDYMADKIRCSHILVAKESLAKEVLDRLARGESFSKLAEQYSIDGTRKQGGDLGFFGRGVMVREFEKAAFGLQKGQTSGIVKSQFGYHIIRRLD